METNQPPAPGGEKTPEQTSKPGKFSRRQFGRLALGAITAVAAGDLVNSRIIQPPLRKVEQQQLRDAVIQVARKRAELLYPIFSPDIKPEQSVVIGYENNEPLVYTYKEGDELMAEVQRRFNRTDETIDTPIPTDIKDLLVGKDTTPLAPDGSQWTLRQRILAQPDWANRAVLRKIVGDNINSQFRYGAKIVNENLPPEISPTSWDLKNTAEAGWLGWRGLGLLRRMIRIQPPQQQTAVSIEQKLPTLTIPSQETGKMSYLRFIKEDPGILPSEGMHDPVSETSPFDLTDEELQKIGDAFQDEKPEVIEKYKEEISTVAQMFDGFLFTDLRIPAGQKNISFYSIGCGRRGALDALAINLVAKRKGLVAKAICIDPNSDSLSNSIKEWQQLAHTGIVHENDAQIERSYSHLVNFRESDPSSPLLVVARNPSPGTIYSMLHRMGLQLLPAMQERYDAGSDARLMVTSDVPRVLLQDQNLEEDESVEIERFINEGYSDRQPLIRAAHDVKFNEGLDLSLTYLHNNIDNPTPTKMHGWDDHFVTVVGFKDKIPPIQGEED